MAGIFVIVGAALTVLEKTDAVPGFAHLDREEIFQKVAERDSFLKVSEKLAAFSIATKSIKTEPGHGTYHLIVLNYSKRRLSIRPFSLDRLDEANDEYANVEKRASQGEEIEAVLVSAGNVKALRRAYPNYFLDTQDFLKILANITRRS